MNHEELVQSAARWLVSAKQCDPVFCEKGSSKSNEMPDVIGWTSGGSILVECKVSRNDFFVDLRKSFRTDPDKGMGKFRYYCFTPSLYAEISILHALTGWGITVIGDDMKVRQVRGKRSKEWEFDLKSELYYLRNRIIAKDISVNSC